MSSFFKICTASAGAAGVVSLDLLPAPVTDPETNRPIYSARVKAGSGKYLNQGAPAVEWHFARLLAAEYEQLAVFCPGFSSAWVYVTTLNGANNYAMFYGLMVWPENPPANKAGMYFDVTIRFEMLAAV